MNPLEGQKSMWYPGLIYRNQASSDDWARVLRTFSLFCGVSKVRLGTVLAR